MNNRILPIIQKFKEANFKLENTKKQNEGNSCQDSELSDSQRDVSDEEEGGKDGKSKALQKKKGKTKGKAVRAGRKPVPCKQYLKTRMLKLVSLNNLSNEKKLPADKRKKYRAQKFAL